MLPDSDCHREQTSCHGDAANPSAQTRPTNSPRAWLCPFTHTGYARDSDRTLVGELIFRTGTVAQHGKPPLRVLASCPPPIPHATAPLPIQFPADGLGKQWGMLDPPGWHVHASSAATRSGMQQSAPPVGTVALRVVGARTRCSGAVPSMQVDTAEAFSLCLGPGTGPGHGTEAAFRAFLRLYGIDVMAMSL